MRSALAHSPIDKPLQLVIRLAKFVFKGPAMTTVNVHEAKTNLSRLLARVEAGEEVIIARNGKPVARLVSVEKRRQRRFGSMKGLISIDERFFEALPEEELAAWEGECKCDYCSTPMR